MEKRSGEIEQPVLGGRAGEQDKLRHFTAGLLYCRFFFFKRELSERKYEA